MTEKTDIAPIIAGDDEKEELFSVEETSLTEDEFQLIGKKRSRNSSQASINSTNSTTKTDDETVPEKVRRLITADDGFFLFYDVFGYGAIKKNTYNLNYCKL